MRAALLACALPACGFAQDLGIVNAAPPANGEPVTYEPVLQPFEAETGGLTKDSDDARYMDVNLSIKIRMLPLQWTRRSRVYLAMATRFAFYWGSRPGSPVIGKSYNPQLLWRWLLSDRVTPSPDERSFEYDEFLDVAFAHQSNGQLVHSPEEYRHQLIATPPAQYADQFIHRGWDYLDVAWKRRYRNDVSVYLAGRYFLPTGLLQGREDEYHSWEGSPEGKPREAVDGLEALVEYPSSAADFAVESRRFLSRPSITLKYVTGYRHPFEFSTVRAELGFQMLSVPLALWAQRGYMSSLAMYYVKVTSVGIEVHFRVF